MLNLVDAMPAGSKCPGQAWRAAKSKIYCMAFVNTAVDSQFQYESR